jgi:hypothetical protein
MPYKKAINPDNCCYQCQKRTMGCHSTCKERADWLEEHLAESRQKKQYLHPAHSHYFKEHSKISRNALHSKKRYR